MKTASFDAVFLLLCAFMGVAAAISGGSLLSSEIPLEEKTNIAESPRKLFGRFLHITDLHTDPFYKDGSSTEQRCHSRKGRAGHFGAEISSCDTPWSLVNETFAWIDKNLKDQIDFVVWTGDSARHDNDVNLPRSSKQIYDLNKKAIDKMTEVFGLPDLEPNPRKNFAVPIVPTLGNNDIFPHNIMEPGPSKVTREYVELWKHLIPEDQYHIFQRGAYFWKQVVAGQNGQIGPSSIGGLAVISLNTLYFFESNGAVDGCDNKDEPGYEQMEWLSIQLRLMRDRGMKAILMGHVPPAWTQTKRSWDPTCWKKYVLWSRQYRDVIVGHLYGHMNLDHFMLLDSHELKPGHKTKNGKSKKGEKSKKGKGKSLENSEVSEAGLDFDLEDDFEETVCSKEFDPEDAPEVSINSAEEYLHSLRRSFAALPEPQTDGAVSSGGDYKKLIGGKFAERYIVTHIGPSVIPNYFPTLRVIEYNITGLVDPRGQLIIKYGKDTDVDAENNNSNKKNKPTDPINEPEGPDKTAPPGPAYSMQPYTWIGYTQYFANLTLFNAQYDEAKEFEEPNVELRKRDLDAEKKVSVQYEVEYDTRTDKIYKLKDMTVRSYLKLAHKIVDSTAGQKEGSPITNTTDVKVEVDVTQQALAVADEDDIEEDIEGVDSDKKKKKKKKNKKKHKKKKKTQKDHIWGTFVKRAFVGTIDEDDLYALEDQREACIERIAGLA